MASSSSGSEDLIELRRCVLEPSTPAPIDAPVKLAFGFRSKKELKEAYWEFKYVVDSASKRHVIEMGVTPKTTYVAGENTFEFEAPKIDITGVKPSVLLNVGLLCCTLFSGSEQIVEIKIVTQVTKRKDGTLMRLMFDPLES